MCRLTKQLQQMSNDVQGDAVLIQSRGSIGSRPDFNLASGIIRRVNSPHGAKWAFSTLMSLADTPLPGDSFIGEIAEVVKNVHYQYGHKFYDHELLAVSYKDASFPHHLIP